VPSKDGTEYLDQAVLSRLSAQTLLTPQAMEGSVAGLHKSPHRGSSVEFAEYREYSPGDDPRLLDWRVYARSDRFYVKEFEAETNLRCYLTLDCSASMSFESEHGPRVETAKRIIATLAYLLIHQGDAAGLLTVGAKGVEELPARRNPMHVRNMLSLLAKKKPSSDADLPKALHDVAERIPRRSLVVVISDFFCDLNELMEAIQHLRFQKHDVCLFHLLDPSEISFSFDRPIRFIDLEGPENLITEPAVIRKQYLEEINAFLENIRQGCNERGVEYRRLILDKPYEEALVEFLSERARKTA
tara:strand:+ start:6378 stop:7280 length:903 start_codon:yes stop_codon:yes gene_type:complete